LIEVDRWNQWTVAFGSLLLLKTFSLARGKEEGDDDDGSQESVGGSEQKLELPIFFSKYIYIGSRV
jgi:hypothetical protein